MDELKLRLSGGDDARQIAAEAIDPPSNAEENNNTVTVDDNEDDEDNDNNGGGGGDSRKRGVAQERDMSSKDEKSSAQLSLDDDTEFDLTISDSFSPPSRQRVGSWSSASVSDATRSHQNVASSGSRAEDGSLPPHYRGLASAQVSDKEALNHLRQCSSISTREEEMEIARSLAREIILRPRERRGSFLRRIAPGTRPNNRGKLEADTGAVSGAWIVNCIALLMKKERVVSFAAAQLLLQLQYIAPLPGQDVDDFQDATDVLYRMTTKHDSYRTRPLRNVWEDLQRDRSYLVEIIGFPFRLGYSKQDDARVLHEGFVVGVERNEGRLAVVRVNNNGRTSLLINFDCGGIITAFDAKYPFVVYYNIDHKQKHSLVLYNLQDETGNRVRFPDAKIGDAPSRIIIEEKGIIMCTLHGVSIRSIEDLEETTSDIKLQIPLDTVRFASLEGRRLLIASYADIQVWDVSCCALLLSSRSLLAGKVKLSDVCMHREKVVCADQRCWNLMRIGSHDVPVSVKTSHLSKTFAVYVDRVVALSVHQSGEVVVRLPDTGQVTATFRNSGDSGSSSGGADVKGKEGRRDGGRESAAKPQENPAFQSVACLTRMGKWAICTVSNTLNAFSLHSKRTTPKYVVTVAGGIQSIDGTKAGSLLLTVKRPDGSMFVQVVKNKSFTKELNIQRYNKTHGIERR